MYSTTFSVVLTKLVCRILHGEWVMNLMYKM